MIYNYANDIILLLSSHRFQPSHTLPFFLKKNIIVKILSIFMYHPDIY
jgi:hypothetical protein